jgi:hypothetical protein
MTAGVLYEKERERERVRERKGERERLTRVRACFMLARVRTIDI